MPSLKLMVALASVLFLASPAVGLPQLSNTSSGDKKALYFLQNNPSGSSLIAFDLSNGQAGNPVRISTAGTGASVFNATSQGDLSIDTLNSQGAVVAGGDYIFAVNTGSNTLAMFKVDASDPTHPQLIGQPVDTQGEFPVSVAYSEALNTVCVVNSGAKNTVGCWTIDGDQLCESGAARPLGLDYLTTPPTFGDGTVSQVGFSPDSQRLIVSVKGPMATNGPGPLFVFPVQNGVVDQQPVKSMIPDITLAFGFTFGLSSDEFLQSDASFGGSLLAIDPSTLMISEVQHTKSSLNLSCWAAYSPVTSKGYIIDASTPQMGEVDMTSGALLDVFQTDPAFLGQFDAVIDGSVSYLIAQAPSLGAFDIQQRTTIQNLDLSNAPGVDPRQWWTGLAMYPTK